MVLLLPRASGERYTVMRLFSLSDCILAITKLVFFVSGIAQTWTLNIAIVGLNATERLENQEQGCFPEQYDRDRDEERLTSMVNYWERLGLLGPIYRLIGRGLNDHEIATQLDITEVNVRGCIAWLTRFLECSDRTELVDYASASLPIRRDLTVA
jgi:DNA-binding CsgD family transcriptional regulator